MHHKFLLNPKIKSGIPIYWSDMKRVHCFLASVKICFCISGCFNLFQIMYLYLFLFKNEGSGEDLVSRDWLLFGTAVQFLSKSLNKNRLVRPLMTDFVAYFWSGFCIHIGWR